MRPHRETISEDPYPVGIIGTAYGLQASGVDATLKHFAGTGTPVIAVLVTGRP